MACTVNVCNGTLPQAEMDAYVQHAKQKFGKEPTKIDITLDGEEVELRYDFSPKSFQRIRRITGYLVGTLDRFNNGKRAEENERVKHSL